MECLIFTTGGGQSVESVIPLLAERGIHVTRCAEPQEWLDSLGRRRWRFLILDASDGAGNALDALPRAREISPGVPAVVLVPEGDVPTAVRAMKAGAADCIEAPVQPACLLAAIGPFDGPRERESEELWRLTGVERNVLWHILDGHTNRQIADLLCRSPRTIEVHRRHVMQKLNAENLIELVRQAMRAGMLGDRQGRVARSHA